MDNFCPLTKKPCDKIKNEEVNILTPLGTIKIEKICSDCMSAFLTPIEALTQLKGDACKSCGTSLVNLISGKRPGCAQCYEHFDFLKKAVHHCQTGKKHCGKVPKNFQIRKQINELKEKIKDLVSKENYEEAFLAKKQIQELENSILNKKGIAIEKQN